MSTFAVPIVRLDDVIPHPNADKLDIAKVGEFQSIVAKGHFSKGDLAVYVPEGAIVPTFVLAQEGLEGKLAGSGKDRVKAIKLRQVLSQGIVIDPKNYPQLPKGEAEDVSAVLGITKYEPPVPVHMAGSLRGDYFGYPLKYDIENRKRYPHILQDHEEVILTEKIHGTFCQIGWRRDLAPDPLLFGDGRVFICSKGLGAKGFVFKNEESNKDNLYVRAMRESGLIDMLPYLGTLYGLKGLYALGEVFGEGVQDLGYGVAAGKPQFRLFDVYTMRQDEASGWIENTYVDAALLSRWADYMNVTPVPIIAMGAWSDIKLELDSFARGKSTIGGNHIREGVVIKPRYERHDPSLGRVILKEVSEDYLLRKGGTEFQ